MAIGDKKSVVMESDRAAKGGIATLDNVGNVPFEQLGNVSRPNLLDNWYFADPINQRGGYVLPPETAYYSDTDLTTQAGTLSAYTKAVSVDGVYGTITVSSTTYYVDWTKAVRGYVGAVHGMDRWRLRNSGSTIQINEDCVSVIGNGGIRQFIENWKILIGKQVTLSLLTKDALYTATNVYTETATTYLVGTAFGLNFGGGRVDVFTREGFASSRDMIAMKLELGDTQTLAYQDENGNWVLNDPPPNKASELAKCQRYYINLDGSFGSVVPGANLGNIQAAIFDVPVPVTMRATPTITDVRDFGICLVNGTWYPITNMNVDTAHAGSVRVFWASNGLTDIVPCVIDGAKFSFSADL